MPLRDSFIEDVLPKPASDTEIDVDAMTTREQAFLDGKEQMTYKITKRDLVTLINLGSQPSVETIRSYAEQAEHIPKPDEAKPGFKHYVFINTGNPTLDKYGELYDELAGRAEQVNADDEESGKPVRLVPYTHRVVSDLIGRADNIVVTPNGLVLGEMLALKQRGDERNVMIHLKIPSDMSPTPPDNWEEIDVWIDRLLEEDLLPWEAGNVYYSMKKLDAVVVTPGSLLSALTDGEYDPEKDPDNDDDQPGDDYKDPEDYVDGDGDDEVPADGDDDELPADGDAEELPADGDDDLPADGPDYDELDA